MSTGVVASISSVAPPSTFHTRPSIVFCLLTLLLNVVGRSRGLRLTNMNAPPVADLREDMKLDCHFDMGMEELYAVKWYKDDHEFFRYMPRRSPDTMTFPVAGVHLVPAATDCSHDHCAVTLRGLTKDHSGGAYRCEISTEAPYFRLVSETHNVTVAALPRQNPRIEGLATSYVEGDIVSAKCVSDLADPAPILSWYINGQQAPSKSVGEMTSSEVDKMGLVSRSLSLRLLVERKHSRGDSIEFRCVSTLPGVPTEPQVTKHTVPVRASNAQVINNQKLHWYSSQASRSTKNLLILVFPVVRWGLGMNFVY